MGSLAGRGYDDLAAILPFALAGIVLALLLGRSINGLALGDDLAAALGQRVTATRTLSGIAIVLLAGAAVAAAGPIAFAGLAVAHVARIVTGADYRWGLAYALVLGPALLVGADIIGRLAVRPSELEVGIVTALLGAPILVWLVRRRGGLGRAHDGVRPPPGRGAHVAPGGLAADRRRDARSCSWPPCSRSSPWSRSASAAATTR